MIALRKLENLPPGHRRRKIAQVLETLERDAALGRVADPRYVTAIVALASCDDGLSSDFRADTAGFPDAAEVSAMTAEHVVRLINRVRRNLDREIGRDPADWDFVQPSGELDPMARRPFPDVRAYLEDVRSPFNVGAVFRTADALGVSEVLLSPFCADPDHPRAARTAMGAVRIVPWRRLGSGELNGYGPLLALELGGTPLPELQFPDAGTLVIGSEEFGVSPELLARCAYRVSVPMRGAKASLNLSVAFGIVMNAWCSALGKSPNSG